ncbi:hypothetical protein TPA0907_56420 [Micromonospora humidisoli]|nr:hypothetical protein TPA0907_56420 [Micromonospora sp. AKA109]
MPQQVRIETLLLVSVAFKFDGGCARIEWPTKAAAQRRRGKVRLVQERDGRCAGAVDTDAEKPCLAVRTEVACFIAELHQVKVEPVDTNMWSAD